MVNIFVNCPCCIPLNNTKLLWVLCEVLSAVIIRNWLLVIICVNLLTIDELICLRIMAALLKACFPVEWHIKLSIATVTFKALETGLPPYFAQQLCPYAPTRALHSFASNFFKFYVAYQPPVWLTLFSCICSHSLELILPRSIRFSESLITFQKHLKTFYFQSAFSSAP